MATINVRDLVQRNITNASTSKTWGGHDRIKTIGASEIGGCIRQLVYKKHDVDKDPTFEQDLGAAERGNLIEDWLVHIFEAELPDNIKLIWAGKEQQTLVHGKQSATPDGLLISEDGKPFTLEIEEESLEASCVYVEIKSIDPRAFDNLNDPVHKHVLQCRQGMQLTYICSETKQAPKAAILIYVNASFLNQIKCFVIPLDTNSAQHLEARANSVWDEYSPDNLPIPEGKLEGGKDCQYCAWRKQCQGTEVSLIPASDNNYVVAVEHKVRDLAVQRKKLHAQTKSDGIELKHIDQVIMETLREADTRKVSGDWGSVTAFSAKSPPRYNGELFAAQGLDPKDFQISGDFSPRLNITLKKSSSDNSDNSDK